MFEVVGYDNDTVVRSYFNRLANATNFALEEIAASNATTDYFLLLGATLHAIQNFYAHRCIFRRFFFSFFFLFLLFVRLFVDFQCMLYRRNSNWVELNPRKDCTCFGTSSFFDAVPNNKVLVPPLAALGSYCNGTNKDSYARPLWEEAYAFAFVASVQWIDTFEAFAALRSNGTYPLLARQPLAIVDETLATSVASDLYYQYRLSLWGTPTLAHASSGRYKGPLSALPFGYEIVKQKYVGVAPKLFYYTRFASAGAKWEQIASALRALPSTPPAYVAPTRSNDSLPLDTNALRAVVVRTLRIASLGGGLANDTADFYAELDVGDALYREATQYDVASSSPAWSTIVFVGASTTLLNVCYTLKDADSFAIASDELVRIAGANATIRFSVNVATGAVTGDVTAAAGTNITTKVCVFLKLEMKCFKK